MRTVIAYDIGDDGARAKVSALLATHGVRIQRSVYVCLLDPTTADEIVSRARSLMDMDDDVLHLIPTCSTCQQGAVSIGQAVDDEVDTPYWVAF